jgi:hypothetical protein
MRRILLITVLVLFASAPSAGATAVRGSDGSRLIQASAGFQRLGDYWVSDDATYSGAISALGNASSCHLVAHLSSSAVATWALLGVQMRLATFGGVPDGETGCTAPRSIFVSTIRVTGRSWQTSLKLRVGSPVSYLTSHYPHALASKAVPGWYGKGYWLVTRRQGCIGECGGASTVITPVLVAETNGGHVTALVLVVGAQGD